MQRPPIDWHLHSVGRSAALLCAVCLILALSGGPSAIAQQPTGAKGDYERSPQSTKANRAGAPQTELPKTIYLTPKSDRLAGPQSTKSSKAETQAQDGQSPGDVLKELMDHPDLLGDGETLPELDLPTDPHVDETNASPKKRPRVTYKKKPKSGRPADVAMKKGKLVLNRFHTMRMRMPHHECRDLPNVFMADYKLPRDEIEILADNMALIQKRICAQNGLVLVTCRQNEATVSLRPARPKDGCDR